MEPARDADVRVLLVFDGDVGRVVVLEGEGDLGEVGGGPRLGAVEDHVLHALAAEVLGGLLAHAPTDGVDDVRLSATVRAYDAHDCVIEVDDRAVHERLETAEL